MIALILSSVETWVAKVAKMLSIARCRIFRTSTAEKALTAVIYETYIACGA